MPQPSVGRVVHYVSHGSPVQPDGTQRYAPECRAAIIAGVPKHLEEEPLDGCPNGTDGNWLADLTVFNPTGLFFNTCAQDEHEHLGGTWHWPERV